jgi:hypothetical protein
LLRGRRIALLNSGEDTRDLAHEVQNNRRMGYGQTNDGLAPDRGRIGEAARAPAYCEPLCAESGCVNFCDWRRRNTR